MNEDCYLLNEDWYELSAQNNVNTTYVIATKDSIVNNVSASGIDKDPHLVYAIGQSHTSLIQPANIDDIGYATLVKSIKETFIESELSSTGGIEDFDWEDEEDDFDIEIDSIEDLDVSFNETIKTDDEAGSEDATEDEVVESEEDSDETIIALSADDDVEIIITEEGGNFELADDELDIDPMLLAIYHDESVGHLNDVKSKLDEHDTNEEMLQAEKILLRAFNTLYGSAPNRIIRSLKIW